MTQTVSKDFWITTFIPFSAAMAASGTLLPIFILFLGGGDVFNIGMISAISSGVSLPLTFIWGKLTDDTRKRKIFVLIAFISGFGILFGYFFAVNIIWLIILAVISGLLLGAGDTAKTMYIFDKYPPDQWEETISKYQQRTGIGACAGLVFGALFQMYFPTNFAIFFLICAILSGGSAILGYFLIKDIKVDTIKQKVERIPIMNLDLPTYSSLFQPRKYISYEVKPLDQESPGKSQITFTIVLFFLAGFLLYLASNLVFTPLSAFMLDLSIGASYIFWIFLAYYIVSVIGFTFAGKWVDKKGNRRILLIGVILRIAAYGTFTIFAFLTLTVTSSFISSFIIVITLLVVSGISYSLMNVALQNTLPRLVQRNIGEILALYSIIIGASAILGSLFSGFIAKTLGYHWLFLFAVIFAVAAFLIYFKAIKKDITPPQ